MMPHFKEIFHNVQAALTVSFVTLIFGAAFGILSGRGAFAGMISSGVIILVTSLFGGTRIQCSGPTAPLTAISSLIVAFTYEEFSKNHFNIPPDHFINITFILGSALVILMAFLRLGKYIRLIPNSVISGFLNGIAILIWFDQIKKLFGIAGEVPFTGPKSLNILITIFSVILLFLLPKLAKRTSRWLHILSPTLITIIMLTALTTFLDFPIERVQLETKIHSFHDFTQLLHTQFPTEWSFPILKLAFPFALQLAFLTYLNTLLTSLVVHRITKARTKQNQDLFAQGLGNMVATLFGGIPGAQTTTRSVLILKERASMRLAGVLVGIFVLLEMLFFQDVMGFMPQALISGILLKIGYDVLDWTPFQNFAQKREIAIMFGTGLLTVLYDLNIAVTVFTALFYIMKFFKYFHMERQKLQPSEVNLESGKPSEFHLENEQHIS